MAVILRSDWKTEGKSVLVDFLFAFHSWHGMCRIITLPSPFHIISKEQNYFSFIMIFSSCHDVICFNFNLNVMHVRGFLNECVHSGYKLNNRNNVGSFFVLRFERF